MRERLPILSVTGTKGKTTVVRILDELMRKKYSKVLRVDTTGAYINGDLMMGLEDSLNYSGLVPTVSPGKYIPLLNAKGGLVNDSIAVLETALGSSARPGLGYKNHKVGIFTNVLEDHIGSSARIQSRQDIADAKEFIFKAIDLDGWAVINADDELVMSKTAKIPKNNNVHRIYCTVVEHPESLPAGYYKCFIKDNYVTICSPEGREWRIVNVRDIAWTFDGMYTPSLYNLLFICAGYFSLYNGVIDSDSLRKDLTLIQLDEEGGRLTRFITDDGITVLADYAHEKYSLKLIGDLAGKLKEKDKKVIGVLRLAYDRTDTLIDDTSQYIAHSFDEFIVYDKIDGYLKKPMITDKRKKFTQQVGKISAVFSESLKKHGAHNVQVVLREDLAIQKAADIAEPGDVVVEIVNDDIPRSISFLRSSFKGLRRVS